MSGQTQTQKLATNKIIEQIEFPMIIDDDYDPLTVTITSLPTITHEPDPETLDDGFGDLYVVTIADWGEESIKYDIYLCRLKDIAILDWEKAEEIRDKYMTVAITTNEYVAQKDDKIICCIYNEKIDKYVVMFFEIIA